MSRPQDRFIEEPRADARRAGETPSFAPSLSARIREIDALRRAGDLLPIQRHLERMLYGHTNR